jgi:CheY-like chemotaxis protein
MTVARQDPTAPTAPQIRERPLILVIDDDPNVGKFLTTRLRKCGVDALFTTDGERGYQIAVREKPSVILSDYFMPVANINYLLWRLRSTAATENIPVFAMSGKQLDSKTTDDLMKGRSGQRGVERIFKKPLNVEEILGAVREYCPLEYELSETDVVWKTS